MAMKFLESKHRAALVGTVSSFTPPAPPPRTPYGWLPPGHARSGPREPRPSHAARVSTTGHRSPAHKSIRHGGSGGRRRSGRTSQADELENHPTLSNLPVASCRWPMGEDRDGVERFRGAEIVHRVGAGAACRSYCAEHAALMYKPTPISYRPKARPAIKHDPATG
jgi:hypothetical protein